MRRSPAEEEQTGMNFYHQVESHAMDGDHGGTEITRFGTFIFRLRSLALSRYLCAVRYRYLHVLTGH